MCKFIYFRCSTDKQDNERQLYTINEYLAKIGDNITNYQIFSDEGVSGGTTIAERQTKEILKQLKKGDLILVVEMSRMSRNFADRVSFIDYCDKIGAKIYNISKQRYVTLNTSDGGIVDIIDSWQDDSFLRNLRKATRQGVEKAKANGKKFGRANENYSVDKVIQEQGRVKASKSRNDKTIHDPEFLSFCRILKRTSKVLQGSIGSLKGYSDLFMLDWVNYKADIFKSLTRSDLLNVIEQMRNARLDNRDLFKSYTLDNSERQISLIRCKIHNTFRIIETYNKNNKIIGE